MSSLYIVAYLAISWASTHYIYFIFTKFIDDCPDDNDKASCMVLAFLWPMTIPMSVIYLTSQLLAKGLK